MSNPGNASSINSVARGLKAAISNPNVSDEAKERAAERLESMQETGELESREAHEANVAIGHKAALSNPNVSEEAKEHSADVLDNLRV
ncbi:conidiation-specific protein 6 [Daedalea quercina L-15889]|uniref:Conidiation-specific protein 6 n=1 Tax=Daedalea quercina L-15889 TaxID=1314783 RepID=A0A165UCJ6_9APHY|nr:conidiation-specific protein 6 [Daedalea quercina L-15889]